MFLLFVDGLGKPSGPSPVSARTLPTLFSLGAFRDPLDATLGISGLPQSGTGQTSLLTGVNAAALLGRHFGPFPGKTLRELLGEKSLFAVLNARKHPWLFANGYSARYLAHLARKPTFASAFALSARLAGQSLLFADDPRALDPWLQKPKDAAHQVKALLADHALLVLEVFMLDYAGHRAPAHLPELLTRLDAFVGALIDFGLPLVLVSDHGNAEEPAHTKHTTNPVPFLAPFAPVTPDLTGVQPALLAALS